MYHPSAVYYRLLVSHIAVTILSLVSHWEPPLCYPCISLLCCLHICHTSFPWHCSHHLCPCRLAHCCASHNNNNNNNNKSISIAPWLQVTLFKGAVTKQKKIYILYSKNDKGKYIKKMYEEIKNILSCVCRTTCLRSWKSWNKRRWMNSYSRSARPLESNCRQYRPPNQ